jgi:hypothetical protein
MEVLLRFRVQRVKLCRACFTTRYIIVHLPRVYRSEVSNDVTIKRFASGFELATILEIGRFFEILLLAWE